MFQIKPNFSRCEGEKPGSYMKKRDFERIPVNIQAEFFYGNKMNTGTVTNLSKNSMYINTKICLPFKSEFEVLIPFKDEMLKVPVIVKSFVQSDDIYNGMDVELLNLPQNYLEFVDSLKKKSVKSLKTVKREMKTFVCKVCRHIEFDDAPMECPICRASLEDFENNPAAIKRPEDADNLSEMEKKHIPDITVLKNSSLIPSSEIDVYVKVGEIEHGMEIDDYINFIDYYVTDANIKKKCISRIGLTCVNIRPTIMLQFNNLTSGIFAIISNCSAHGSWMTKANF